MSSLKPLWLLGAAMLACTLAAEPHSRWNVRVWQASNAPQASNVLNLQQMEDGHLWVATPGGVARFDGFAFDDFALKELPGIAPSTRIRQCFWNRRGGLWLLLDAGRAVLITAKGVEQVVEGLPPDLQVGSGAEDGEGALWIAYRNGALCRVFQGKIRFFGQEDGWMESDATFPITTDLSGRLWWGTNIKDVTRIGTFRNNRIEQVAELPFALGRLAPASDGGVWIAVRYKLLKYHERTGLRDLGFLTPDRLDTRVAVLHESRHGGLWIGTFNTGLFYFDGIDFEAIPTSSRIISALTEDAEGNLWVGSENGSLNRVQRRAIDVEGSLTGLAFETVHTLSEDIQGQIWAVTHSGVPVRRVEDRWEVLAHAAMSDGRVTCTATDDEGGVWFGTSKNELHRLKDGRLRTWSRGDGIAGGTVRTIVCARNGDVWIGFDPLVVQRLRADKVETISLPTGSYNLRTMVEDVNGDIWMAGSRGTLIRARGDDIFDESNQLESEDRTISSVYPAADGSLWVAYIGGGLGRLKHGKFARITTRDGLYDDFLAQMIDDEKGSFWFGSQKGLFRVKEAELTAVADGLAERVRSVSYAGRDGLPSLQTNFAYSSGALRNRAGLLYLPLGAALAIIDPERVRENLEPPVVLVKKAIVDGQTAGRLGGLGAVTNVVDFRTPRADLHLQAGHRRVEFDFTALALSGVENVRFRHRLEGFEEKWVEAGAQRGATYSRLPPGNYRFRVTACNRDGVWNEVGAAISLRVAPYVWQRWWFVSIAVVIFTSVIVLIVRYLSFRRLQAQLLRVEQEAALDKERTRIARDIHDDLGGRLTRIVLLTGLAMRQKSDPFEAQKRVGEIANTARNVIKSLDQTVWAINPRNDTLPDLVNYVGQYAAEFLHAAEIRYHLQLPDHPPRRNISAEARHNIFSVAKEALNNIVKHAGPCEVRLEMVVDDKGLTMTITDTGKGFVVGPNEPGADGLLNMSQRIEEIGGRYSLTSEPGKGTTVRVEYPWT